MKENGTICCFALTVGNFEIAMPTRDISVLHSETGKLNARFAWMDTLSDGRIRLAFDLSRIFFPDTPSRPTRAVILAPDAVPDGLRRSFEARHPGRTIEFAFFCERIDREMDIPASIFRPLPKVILVEGILGAFSQLAFFDGAAYPLLQARDLIDNVIRFRRSLP